MPTFASLPLSLIAPGPPFATALARFVRGLPVMESDRGHYVVTTLFDTHFLLVWWLTTLAILASYRVVQRPTWRRVLLLAALDIAVTLGHVHSGAILVAVSFMVLALCVAAKNDVRGAFAALCTSAVVVGIVSGALIFQFSSSGLPMSSWWGAVYPHELFFAFPLAWILVATGLHRFLDGADLRARFVTGWIMGCTMLTMSALVQPQSERGTMTLQIALYIAATAIYFGRFKRFTWQFGGVAALILLGTPAIVAYDQWASTTFSPDRPYIFETAEHRATIDVLAHQGRPNDLLLVEKSGESHHDADLWLAPEFPGRVYCCHFWLTVHHDERFRQVAEFFAGTATARERFLEKERIRWVFVAAPPVPAGFEGVPGLVPVLENGVGTLYRYEAAGAHD